MHYYTIEYELLKVWHWLQKVFSSLKVLNLTNYTSKSTTLGEVDKQTASTGATATIGSVGITAATSVWLL
jgi:hypothetical protein